MRQALTMITLLAAAALATGCSGAPQAAQRQPTTTGTTAPASATSPTPAAAPSTADPTAAAGDSTTQDPMGTVDDLLNQLDTQVDAADAD